MAKNVTIAGAAYSAVPSIDVPQTGGGTASFYDVSGTTATAADVAQGKVFYAADGTETTGTASGGGGGGTITQDQDGYIVISESGGTTVLQSKSVTPSESVQDVTADTGYGGLSQVSVGAISSTYVGSGVTRKAAETITPGTWSRTIASGTYLTGAQTIVGDADLIASNIKHGVNIFGVTGTYSGEGGTVTGMSVTVECLGELTDQVFDVIFWEVSEGESSPNCITLYPDDVLDFSCKADSLLFIVPSDPTDTKTFSTEVVIGDGSLFNENGAYSAVYIGTDDSDTVAIEITN